MLSIKKFLIVILYYRVLLKIYYLENLIKKIRKKLIKMVILIFLFLIMTALF